MAPEQPNPDEFISISSSDEDSPPPSKRKRTSGGVGDSLDRISDNAVADGVKRARLSSSVGSSILDAKVSEEGEIDEDESFSSSAKNQTPGHSDAEKKTESSRGVFLPQDPPLFVQDALSLRLPVFSQQRKGSWISRFKDWVTILYTSNPEHVGALTPALVHIAYKQYIDCHSGLKQAKKRGAKDVAANMEATGALADLLSGIASTKGSHQHGGASGETERQPLEPSTGSADGDQQVPSTSAVAADAAHPTAMVGEHDAEENGDLVAPSQTNGLDYSQVSRKNIPTGDDAEAQQRRYFPSASDPAKMCLLCGQEGHAATDCQGCSCRFCGRDDHWVFACPTIPTRCGKCKQLGHVSKECVEKLALTKDEGLACAYCKAPDHMEDECTEIWRSYEPLAHIVKTISHLPSTCALCGSGQHYSGDCSQRQWAVNPTWSLRNRNLYIDPASESTAIEESYSAVGKKPNQPDLKIRGHAASRTHVQYESEDSDTEFLGQRAVANRPRIGQIRVSSNIQMPPPPPLPTSSTLANRYPPPPGLSGNSLPQRPNPPSLPSKPPPQNYHSVPPPLPFRGGYGGGRGGRGGRGRGKGR